MSLQLRVDELKAYIDKWALDVKKEFNLGGADLAIGPGGVPITGHSIGISFEPSVQLAQLPGDEPTVMQGFYKAKGSDTVVEVVSVNFGNQVMVDVGGPNGEQHIESMTLGLFQKLFEPTNVV